MLGKSLWRHVVLAVFVLILAAALVGCSTSTTAVNREMSARPRIEQVALSSAMEDAYNKIDFRFCKDQRVFIETKALSKTDVDYIGAFVQKKVLAAGGSPVLDEKDAKLKLTSTVGVSGTDEVKRSVGRDVVVGQFSGTLSVVNLEEGTVLKVYDLDSVAQSKRNRKATTSVVKR